MLAKKNRLTTKEFETVYKEGKKTHSPSFMCVIQKTEGLKKISVAVSKKVEKRAVDRVASRRKIYNILKDDFEVVPENISVVVIVKKSILEIDKKVLEKEILQFFKIKKGEYYTP